MKRAVVFLILVSLVSAYATWMPYQVQNVSGMLNGYNSSQTSTFGHAKTDSEGRLYFNFVSGLSAAPGPNHWTVPGAMLGWDNTSKEVTLIQLDDSGNIALGTVENMVIGTLEVTGDATVAGDLDVTGAFTAGSFTISALGSVTAEAIYVSTEISAASIKNRTSLYAWDAGGAIAIPNATWVNLTWDTVVDANGYTLAGGGSDITITAAGTYEVNYQVNIWSDTTETRASYKFRCYNITDAAEEAESLAYQWLRAPSGEATVNCTFIEGFAASDQIKIQVQRQYGDLTNTETLPGSRIFIKRID